MTGLERVTRNLTFDVKYAEGDTKHVETGILFEVKEDGIHTGIHMGTTKALHVFAAIEALEEMVQAAGLEEVFKKYREAGRQKEKEHHDDDRV